MKYASFRRHADRPYVMVAPLGAGRMGEVYRARSQGALGAWADIISGTADPVTAATTDATTNDFTDGLDGATVTIHNPPAVDI